MKDLLITILFCSSIFDCFAQQGKILQKEDTATLRMRDIVVQMDTTVEYNSPVKGSNSVDFLQVNKGLRLLIVDNTFRLFYFNEYADSSLNGVHMEFYLPSNMPKVKGRYLNNQKDGEWFYWNKNGSLYKKEIWKKGRIFKRVKC